jgi:putative N6-adenine-specific DNA methylase
VDIEQPVLKLNLHIFQNECTLSLDSSGESLHRRGYRSDANLAPLNEVTAAALVLYTGWNGEGTFIDGMCGSGTILIEAAMIARNIPPNLKRKWFGFMGWKNFDRGLWTRIHEEAVAGIKETKAVFIGNDAVYKVIEIARGNAMKAGLQDDIKLSNKRFEEQRPPEGGGILVMNPPYGERLEVEEINSFYRLIGDTLKKNFSGFDAWILSSNKAALKHMHLNASRKLVVWNGQLECKFHKYEMYKGTKREVRE